MLGSGLLTFEASLLDLVKQRFVTRAKDLCCPASIPLNLTQRFTDTRVTAVATTTLSPDGPTLTTVARDASAPGQNVISVTLYEKSR